MRGGDCNRRIGKDEICVKSFVVKRSDEGHIEFI